MRPRTPCDMGTGDWWQRSSNFPSGSVTGWAGGAYGFSAPLESTAPLTRERLSQVTPHRVPGGTGDSHRAEKSLNRRQLSVLLAFIA